MLGAFFIALLVGTSQGLLLDSLFSDAAEQLFGAADVNVDGFISYAEIMSEFAKIDTDMSGEVSRHEFTEFICAESPTLYNMGHYLYDEFDFNKDHHLQPEDYRLMLATADTNKDGLASKQEFTDFAFNDIIGYLFAPNHVETHNHGVSACH